MAAKKDKSSPAHPNTLHPGSSVEDARAVGGKGDFGARESDVVERTYTSRNTKLADPGSAQGRGGDDGSRTSGVGGNNSGIGSSSGGDLDTDIVGVGMGPAISASGKNDDAPGPDDATGTSRDFAAGKPAAAVRKVTNPEILSRSAVQSPDENATAGQGADAVSKPEADLDDSFSGEISSSEASGRDEAGD